MTMEKGEKREAEALQSCVQHQPGRDNDQHPCLSMQGCLRVQGSRLGALQASRAGSGAFSGRADQVLYLKGRLAGITKISIVAFWAESVYTIQNL